jgi:ribonuclease T2
MAEYFVACRRMRVAAVAALLVLGLAAGDVMAQRPPYRERPDDRDDDRGGRRGREHVAGVFDYYLLALSWSPTFCADVGDRRRDPQCSPRGRPYAFVLHGLWPQYERRWPQDCNSPDRGYVPPAVAQRMLDIMPSERLVFHEYRKHGTCSGLGVDGYFDLARRLHDKVRIPPRFLELSDPRTTVSPNELMQDFMAANPGLEPDMIAVQCGGAGNRLKEVRVCFDKGGEFRACGRNENQAKLCSAARMYVPPVRPSVGQRRDREDPADRPPAGRGPGQPPDTLPGPRGERRL